MAFAAFAAALIGVRLFLIVTQQWSGTFDGDLPESLASGRAAFDLLNGSWRGWITYLYITGGHLANELAASALALPLFWAFGPSLLALAAVPVLIAVLTAALLFRLSGSRDAAIMATAYFVFMPLNVQSWLIYPYLTHGEAATWFLLALWILNPVLAGVAIGPARPFSAGMVIGFGIAICDTMLLAPLSIAAALLLGKAPRLPRRQFTWAAAGIAAGAMPYAGYMLTRPGSVLLFYESLAHIGGDATSVSAYVMPFSFVSSMIWPLAQLVANAPMRAVAGLAVIAGLIWRARRATAAPGASRIELAVCAFTMGVVLLNVLLRSIDEYYMYTLAAPMAFLAGGALADLAARLPFPRGPRIARYVLVGLGSLVTLPSLAAVDLRSLQDQWARTRVARGYSFYAPEPYRVFSGYKTPLGQAVEAAASARAFSRQPRPDRAEKVIFIGQGLDAAHPLEAREDYFIYGADVTFAGVARLSAEAKETVAPMFWPEVFGGMAVMTANDFLLGELITKFTDGTIDRFRPAASRCSTRSWDARFGIARRSTPLTSAASWSRCLRTGVPGSSADTARPVMSITGCRCSQSSHGRPRSAEASLSRRRRAGCSRPPVLRRRRAGRDAS